jgi:hypothetical protein
VLIPKSPLTDCCHIKPYNAVGYLKGMGTGRPALKAAPVDGSENIYNIRLGERKEFIIKWMS